jgi:hypothetical protein
MKSECVGLSEKGTVAKKVVFGIGEIVPKMEGFWDCSSPQVAGLTIGFVIISVVVNCSGGLI